MVKFCGNHSRLQLFDISVHVKMLQDGLTSTLGSDPALYVHSPNVYYETGILKKYPLPQPSRMYTFDLIYLGVHVL